MANAVSTLVVKDVDDSRRTRRKIVSITTDGGDYVANGITLDLSGVTNPSFFPAAKFGRNPFLGGVSNQLAAYQCELVPGTALTNWKLKIFSIATAAELSGAMPAVFQAANDLRLTFVAVKNL